MSIFKRSVRLVAYDPKKRLYLRYDCLGTTADRVWAWSGTLRQANNMVQQFPAAEGLGIYWDGEERSGGSPLYVA